MELLLAPILVFTGAAIASTLSFIGSALGMNYAGQAASGATSEKPELFGKMLLMQALPGSQGIYGLVGAFLILSFAGFLGGDTSTLTVTEGAFYAIVGLPIGLSGLLSGMLQGRVAATGVLMIAKDDSLISRAIIYSAMVETWAIFGLLIGFILLTSI